MAYPFNGVYYPQNYPQYQIQQNTPQIQNGGLVPVPNIEVARNYHVAPGTSVIFVDENAPYVYVKTRGFSQFDPPVFKKKRLVDEDDTMQDAPQTPKNQQKQPVAQNPVNSPEYATKGDIKALRDVQEALQKEINLLKESLGGIDDDKQ